MPELIWQKSAYSGDSSNCIYVAADSMGAIHLRESDEPETILTTTPSTLRSLILRLSTASQSTQA